MNGKEKVEEDSSFQSDPDEMDHEYLAFHSRRFSKLKFKRITNMSKLEPQYKRNFRSNKEFVDKSKFKCYNCGMVSHFSNECGNPKTDKKPKFGSGVDYKKKYFELLKQIKKAFVYEERDCAIHGDDFEDEKYVNLH